MSISQSAVSNPISTHAPAGGATPALRRGSRQTKFLLTPLREGRRNVQTLTSYSGSFLLTPLREGRRELGDVTLGHTYISTHAPAGGATLAGILGNTEQRISTHAPAGGATKAKKSGTRRNI